MSKPQKKWSLSSHRGHRLVTEWQLQKDMFMFWSLSARKYTIYKSLLPTWLALLNCFLNPANDILAFWTLNTSQIGKHGLWLTVRCPPTQRQDIPLRRHLISSWNIIWNSLAINKINQNENYYYKSRSEKHVCTFHSITNEKTIITSINRVSEFLTNRIEELHFLRNERDACQTLRAPTLETWNRWLV